MADISPINVEHGNAIKAWEQQETEPSLAYTYFRYYLDLGAQRSIEETVRVLVADDKIKRAPTVLTLREYQRAYRWVFRAELWDRHDLATQARLEAERRREELRLGLEEYQKVQSQMAKGLAALASKVLRKTTMAIDTTDDSEWTLDRASRLMATLNTTATTAAGLWSDSLGVEKLTAALSEMDAQATADAAAFAAQVGPPVEQAALPEAASVS